MDEMKQVAKKKRLIAAILVLLATITMALGGIKMDGYAESIGIEEMKEEMEYISSYEIQEFNESMRDAGISYTYDDFKKDFNSLDKIVKDDSFSLYEIAFKFPRFMKLLEALDEMGELGPGATSIISVLNAVIVAIYISLAVCLLFVVLLFLNKRCFSIIPIIITFIWFAIFGLGAVGASESDGVTINLHFMTYLSVIFAVAGCVFACIARGKDKPLKLMNNQMGVPYMNGQPYGMQNQYGAQNQYGMQEQYGAQDPYGMQNQYGAQNSYGMQEQYGAQNQYGVQNQYGADNSYAPQNPYGTQNQYSSQDSYTGSSFSNTTDQSSGWGNFDSSNK